MIKDQTNASNSFLPKNSDIEYIRVTDGTRLRIGFFPAVGDAVATILLVSGHREFLEKYTEFIEEFQKKGIDVYAYDHRGQGLSDRMLSDRQKSHNPEFGLLVSDMNEIVTEIIMPKKDNLPLYLAAHSMGAQIALRYLHDYPAIFERAVLLSPFTGFNIGSPIFSGLALMITKIANLFGFSEYFAPGQAKHRDMIDHDYAFSRLTHDQRRYNWSQDAIKANPDLFVGGVTYGWMKGVVNSIKILQKPGFMGGISTPILALLVEEEHVVDNKMTLSLLANVQNATIKIISDARHESYRETDDIRACMWSKISKFLKVK